MKVNMRTVKDENPAQAWLLKKPYSIKTLIVLCLTAIFLFFSAQNIEIEKLYHFSVDWVKSITSEDATDDDGRGINGFLSKLFPPQISEIQEVYRVENFDADNLPLFSYVETREEVNYELDTDTFEMVESTVTDEYLVQPVGYLKTVAIKMLETLEIGIWGTILAILLSVPLTIWSARNYSPNILAYSGARSVVSLFRAIPELISALILVIAFGFGPIPGILALGIHCAGFLGKFYAEDIENADKGPQDALFAIGASKLKVLWLAVLPQVFPQYIAYTLYILDRNVRMAAVVGIVGAGGIGLELKGRFDMFHYSHVGTILLVLFITVLLLDQLSASIRRRIIG